MAAKIDQWACLRHYQVVSPNSEGYKLGGYVTGHKRAKDGDEIMTSTVIGKRGENIITRNSEYELGEPLKEFEAQYPGAKKRLLASLKEIPHGV